MPHGKPFARASGQDHSTGRAVGTNKFAYCMLLAAKICATFRPNNQVLESLEPLTHVGRTIAPKPFAWSSRRHCTWGASSMFGQPLVFPILPCDEALYVFHFLSKRTTNSTSQKHCAAETHFVPRQRTLLARCFKTMTTPQELRRTYKNELVKL